MDRDESSSPKLDQRTVELLRLALTASPEELFQVVQERSSELLLTALKNPQLNDGHLRALLARRDLNEATLKAVFQLDQVKCSRQLQICLVKNPNTPSAISWKKDCCSKYTYNAILGPHFQSSSQSYCS